jgi:peroxiredoxin
MYRPIIAVLALAISFFAQPVISIADLTPPNARNIAPGFRLIDSQGTPIKLSVYKGRVVLLDFWATWCTGCKTEIPWYVEFLDKFKDRGLSAIGVAMDEDGWKSVHPFLVEHKINYPIVIGNEKLGNRFGVSAMPVTLLIDRNGKIADKHVGMVDKDAFDREIQLLLKEPYTPPQFASAGSL